MTPSLNEWPEFPPAMWRDTYATLHMWMQIVGKTRLALAPMENTGAGGSLRDEPGIDDVSDALRQFHLHGGV